MIVQESFLKKLRVDFDLNIYEVKIWTSLLSRGIAAAGELADISGVPRSRTYDVLESLEKKGFVIMKLGKPIRYIAIDPEDVIIRVKQDMHNKAKERLQSLDKVKDTQIFRDISLLYNQGIEKIEPSEMSGIIKGRKNLYNHLKTLISNSKESVVMVTTEKGLIKKSDVLLPVLKKAKKRGVNIRVATNTKNVPEAIKNFIEFKQITDQKARFTIVDQKNILFMINHDESVHESYDLGIWVKTPFFASAMQQMFELTWAKVKSV
ncbi:MAG: helix-turn-helix domain-containing protein [Nanoarchaeota archaeon]|nr:helix-turn-helix domain-containing protein [Nanoarchaeota archaeon]